MTSADLPRGLALVVHSGAADRVQYALVLAAAAAAIGRPVILFLAGDAVRTAVAGPVALPGFERFEEHAASTSAPGLQTLWDACAELGVRRIACETALRLANLPGAAVVPGIEVAGAVTLLAASTGWDSLFV